MKPKIAVESFKRLTKVKEQLVQDRKRYDTVWKEAARFINPNMSDWNDEPNQTKPEDNAHIYDTTVQKASQNLTDGIQGYSFSRNQAWNTIALEDEEELTDSEAQWLETAERRINAKLQKSTFYDEGRTFVKCGADFGTAIMMRVDDMNRGVPVYKTQHIKRCYIDENEYGEVDVLFRDFWINAYKAAALFGYENLPERIKTSYDNVDMKLFKFTQAILPPDRYDLDVPRSKVKPFYTLYWADIDQNNPIMDDGYPIKSFFVWRWSRNLDGDVWGVDAPGMLMVPEVKMLNTMRADYSRLLQLAARPPIKATQQLQNKIKFTPNGVTYLPAGQDFTPAIVTGRVDAISEDIQDIRRTINESYYNDFFLILSQNIEKDKTATEVSGLQGEKAAILSAFYGRLTSEFLEPVLEDIFSLELNTGGLPIPPDSLREKDLRIDMISPLAMMQKRYLIIGASQQALAEIFALAQASPTVLDNLDLDVHVRNIADAYGLDKRVVRDLVDVEKLRQARNNAQQALLNQQMQLEQAKVGADIVSKIPNEGAQK